MEWEAFQQKVPSESRKNENGVRKSRWGNKIKEDREKNIAGIRENKS